MASRPEDQQMGLPDPVARPRSPEESMIDIQEIDTYTRANRRSTDLLAGVVQHPENQCRWRKEHELFQTVFSRDPRGGVRVNLRCLRQRAIQSQHPGHGL